MTRAFVAIGLPPPQRAALAKVQSGLGTGRLVDTDDLHLTLVFLGALDDQLLDEVHDALSAIRAPEFDLRISGLGTFGREFPRALWAGVAPEPALGHLQAKVASAVRRIGVELPARRFVPHVTLARFRPDRIDANALNRCIAAHAGLSLAAFPVRSFGLYASHLGRDGAHYEELATYPLQSVA